MTRRVLKHALVPTPARIAACPRLLAVPELRLETSVMYLSPLLIETAKLASPPAYLYPGSGSFILQLLVAGILGWWRYDVVEQTQGTVHTPAGGIGRAGHPVGGQAR
jgi:hypothetical protein